MKFKALIAGLILLFSTQAFAAWTFNSTCSYQGTRDAPGGRFFSFQCDLNSDGAAETAIDVWANFIANTAIPDLDLNEFGDGGVLYSVKYKQGTTAPDNDFLLTIYNGENYAIFSETIDFDEAGQGVTGGYYSGDTTEGSHPEVWGGLTIDVADVGASGDDIILTFTFLIKEK